MPSVFSKHTAGTDRRSTAGSSIEAKSSRPSFLMAIGLAIDLILQTAYIDKNIHNIFSEKETLKHTVSSPVAIKKTV